MEKLEAISDSSRVPASIGANTMLENFLQNGLSPQKSLTEMPMVTQAMRVGFSSDGDESHVTAVAGGALPANKAVRYCLVAGGASQSPASGSMGGLLVTTAAFIWPIIMMPARR
jgi:hypothetical protein